MSDVTAILADFRPELRSDGKWYAALLVDGELFLEMGPFATREQADAECDRAGESLLADLPSLLAKHGLKGRVLGLKP